MDLYCYRYASLNKKLFYKKLKRYGGIFKCSRKAYRKKQIFEMEETRHETLSFDNSWTKSKKEKINAELHY